MSAPDLDELVRVARGAVRALEHSFEDRDDDWSSLLLLSSPTLGCRAVVVAIDEPALLVSWLANARAIAAVFIMPVWCVEAVEPEWVGSLAAHPRRTEAVTLACVDDTRMDVLTAHVRRYADRPPALGGWEETGSVGDTVANALRLGMEGARDRRA